MSGMCFPSSGNEEQDEAIARDINKSQAALDKSICPNDATPLKWLNPFERECPKCKFHQGFNTPQYKEGY